MALHFLQEKYELLGWGELGTVFKVSDHVVVKFSTTKNPRFGDEIRIFEELERHPPSPHIVYSFLRLENMNFMQYLAGGNLETRLQSRQRRAPKTGQVLEVYEIEAEHLILRWMNQLTSAAAWLESLGLAHGDIRPSNLLLDGEDHLKLADFDNTKTVGTEVEVGTAPYARVLGDEAGRLRGSFGLMGPRTEQFAIGSVFYYMTNGYEPYDDQWYGEEHGPHTVEMLQRMELPDTTAAGEKGCMIRKCWYGEFHTMKDLANTARLLGGQEEDAAQALTPDFIQEVREQCKRIMADWSATTPMIEQTGRHASEISHVSATSTPTKRLQWT